MTQRKTCPETNIYVVYLEQREYHAIVNTLSLNAKPDNYPSWFVDTINQLLGALDK